MVQIPDALRSLFSATLSKQDNTYTIEVPTNEVDHNAVYPGTTYRIAFLETTTSKSDGKPSSTAATPDKAGENQPLGPPVEEGEYRTVTVDALGDQGDGIAKVERGFVVIIPEAVPGDRSSESPRSDQTSLLRPL